jgi:hypothetical protein
LPRLARSCGHCSGASAGIDANADAEAGAAPLP